MVYTLGHSTRSIGEIVSLLESRSSRVLVDVRRWASSRKSPWLSRETLSRELSRRGIRYIHAPALGGYRSFGRDAPRSLEKKLTCFKSKGFNAYTAYLLTSPQGWRTLEPVVYTALAGVKPTLMCSERLPWRCHRKIVSDVLKALGFKVIHILGSEEVEHEGTACYPIIAEAFSPVREFIGRVL